MSAGMRRPPSGGAQLSITFHTRPTVAPGIGITGMRNLDPDHIQRLTAQLDTVLRNRRPVASPMPR
jgi:hypothetical protein